MLDRIKDNNTGDKETEDLAIMMTETALINSGYTVPNTNEFAKRFNKLFYGALGISKDAPIEDIEVTLDDEEDKEEKKDGESTDDSK